MAKKVEAEQTQAEAPYALPDGWRWCRQSDVCRLADGEKMTNAEYPYLEVKYLRGTKEKEFVSSGKFIMAGTKVILVDGENSGEVFTVPEDGYMGSTFKSLSIQNVDAQYLQFFITTKKDLYRNNKKGSAIPHLNKDLFFNMPFPLPPTLAEQRRIVARIERLFAKLDGAQEKAQSVLDGFETRKAAILYKAFAGELTAKWRAENGVDNDSWEEKMLNNLCEVTSSKRIYQEEQTSEGIPFLRISDLICKIQGAEKTSDLFISKKTYCQFKEQGFVPKAGDILITARGTIGKCYLVKSNDEFYFQDGMISWLKNIDARILSMYLLFMFQSKLITNQIDEMQNGSTVSYLSISMLKKISIPVPTLPEQQEIVRILDAVLQKESRAKDAAQEVLEQIALLKKAVLARAFRGGL